MSSPSWCARPLGRGALNTLAGLALSAAPALAQGAATTLPTNYTCSGTAPAWTLEIAGTTATYSAGATGTEDRKYKGELTNVGTAKTPFVVWRGRLDAGLREVVAMVALESCSTGQGAAAAKDEAPFSARVSLPQGDVRTGCCRPSGPDASYTAPAGPAAGIARVTGTVTYRQRAALGPDAVLKVALVEASRAEPAPAPISELSLGRPGQVPIAFELPYPAARINPKRAYVVRAAIEQGGETVMASTRSYPVITAEKPAKVEIVLEPAKPATPPQP